MKKFLLFLILFVSLLFTQDVVVLNTLSLFGDSYPSYVLTHNAGFYYLQSTSGVANTFYSKEILTGGSGDFYIYIDNQRDEGDASNLLNVYIRPYRGKGFSNYSGKDQILIASFTGSDTVHCAITEESWFYQRMTNNFDIMIQEASIQQNSTSIYIHHAKRK